MIEINVRFHEEYKRLDAICRDMFSSKDGVTQYIYEMDRTHILYSRKISDWDETYNQLRRFRRIRNQLAHEIGAFDYNLCTEEDVEWLEDFYNAVTHCTDPLAEVGKMKRQQIEQQNKEKLQRTQADQSKTIDNKIESKPKASLWSRIKAKLKEWFS